jgi:monoamine oxidase
VFETPCGISEETFEHVVLAIPFAVLRTLDYSEAGFDELKQTAIRDLGAGVNSKLQLQFAARLWNTPGPWGLSNGSSYADTGYSSTWEATRAQPGDQGILVLYAGGTPSAQFRTQVPFGNQSLLSVREDAADALSRLAPVYPGLEYVSRATLTLPHLSESFRASYAYWRVGQYVAFAGYEAARQGNIYFAGEHTSLDYQGFMEGGASEGLRASKELRRRL